MSKEKMLRGLYMNDFNIDGVGDGVRPGSETETGLGAAPAPEPAAEIEPLPLQS